MKKVGGGLTSACAATIFAVPLTVAALGFAVKERLSHSLAHGVLAERRRG